MLNGSSALNFEGSRQITKPTIELKIRENSLGVSAALMGATPGTEGPLSRNRGVNFKGQYVFNFGAFFRFNENFTGRTRTVFSVSTGGDFLNLGNTLIYFYMDNTSLRSMNTTDGINWGNSQIGISLGNFLNLNLNVVGETELYTTVGTSGSGNFKIVKIINSGSWGVTDIGNKAFHSNNASATNYKLSARRVDNLDYFLFTTGKSTLNAQVNKVDDIHLAKTDGINLYESGLLLEGDESKGPNSISYVSQGVSRFYFTYHQHSESTTETDITGITNTNWHLQESYMFSSPNMQDWTAPLYLGQSARSATNDNVVEVNTVIAGLSDNIEVVLNGESQNFISLKGSTEIDISENLVSYSNTNNQRVTLTLGNYK